MADKITGQEERANFTKAIGYTLKAWIQAGYVVNKWQTAFRNFKKDPIAWYKTQQSKPIGRKIIDGLGLWSDIYTTTTSAANSFEEMKKLGKLSKDQYEEMRPSPASEIAYVEANDHMRQETLGEVQRELARVAEQSITLKKDAEDYFKMGTVELHIPPVQISVNDIKNNFTFQTLRSGDITIDSGHSVKMIDFDVYFHDIDSINDKLIPLLAQLKASPFVPFYSKYLDTIFIPLKKIDEKGPQEQVDEYKVIDAKSKLAKTKIITTVNNIVKDNQKIDAQQSDAYPYAEGVNKYLNGTLEKNNPYGIDPSLSLQKNMKKIIASADPYSNVIAKDAVKKPGNDLWEIWKLENELNSYSQNRDQLFTEIHGNRNLGNTVGVLSQISISTVAGFPESLACHMSFFLFNYYPFSLKFEFLDSKNNPTKDIDKCRYFIEWYAKRFLSQGKPTSLKPLSEPMSGLVDFKYNPEDSDTISLSIDKERAITTAISIVVRNSIAFLPVLSHSVPTCQYMGKRASEIILTLDIVDKSFIDELNYLFNKVDKVSRQGDKIRRLNWVSINNELLSLCGIHDVILQTMEETTVPGSPGITRAALKFIEFDVDQNRNQVIEELKPSTAGRVRALIKTEMSHDNERNILLSDRFLRGVRIAPKDKKLKRASHDVLLDYSNDLLSSSPEVEGAPDLGFNKRGFDINSEVTGDRSRDRNRLQVEGERISVVLAYAIKKQSRDNSFSIPDKVLDAIAEHPASDFMVNKFDDQLEDWYNGDNKVIPNDVMQTMINFGLDDKFFGAVNTYPDMDLPSYRETGNPGCPKPTYKDLGSRLGLYSSGPARDDGDTVEPDFYMKWDKIRSMPIKIGDEIVSFDGIKEAASSMCNDEITKMVDNIEEYTQTSMKSEDNDSEAIKKQQQDSKGFADVDSFSVGSTLRYLKQTDNVKLTSPDEEDDSSRDGQLFYIKRFIESHSAED